MKKYRLVSKAVWIPEKKILVIADLHLGFEEAMNLSGINIPRVMYKQLISELSEIFFKVGAVKEFVILGDLKEMFGKISYQESREIRNLIDFLEKRVGKIILIKGNHDVMLPYLLKNSKVSILTEYLSGEFGFLHGDKLDNELFSNKNIKTIFIGHIHPAVSIVDGVKKEKYRCFLFGKYKKKELVVLPSFLSMSEGVDVTKKENFGKRDLVDLSKFDVFVPVSFWEVLEMGSVGRLRRD